MIKMGNSEAIVSDVKDAILNTFAEMAHALSGCEGTENEEAQSNEIERLFRIRPILKAFGRNVGIWGISKCRLLGGEGMG